MIIDKRLTFTASQALTTSAVLSDSIDLGVTGVPGRDIGAGQPIYWVLQNLTLPAATGTYAFTLQSDEDPAFASPSVVATITLSPTSPAGSIQALSIPPVNNSNERYLRVSYVGGGVSPAVTVASHLTSEAPAAWQAYDAPFQD